MAPYTLWFQLEDMFQLIVTPQGIEKVTIQLKDTPTKVYRRAHPFNPPRSLLTYSQKFAINLANFLMVKDSGLII